ncbi:MAG TPA: HlyD family secretion protein [Flavobacteriales bacterium]|nr:HlyD family secretion protein [Flavobacteriales bacterium]
MSESKEESIEKKSPVRLVSIVILSISFVLLILHILMERFVPFTDQAHINGLMSPIVPRVSGYLTDINVRLHSRVEVGDTLFQLDRRPFVLSVEKARATLDKTAQNVKARTSSVKSSAHRLGVAKAQMDRAQRNWNRVQIVLKENPGALSQADRDAAETSLMQATEQVASAEADLERSQQALGFSGEENPQFREALNMLEQAELDLAFSSIIAASGGYVESFSVDLGYYASGGQPLATLVTDGDMWIQANLKENNLSNMKEGAPVEFSIDVMPGKIFKGKVRSIGHGVSTGNTNRGDLPSVSGESGWLRDPQRFPVIITFDQNDIKQNARLGGQVDVVIFSGDKGFLSFLAKMKLRFLSFMSYVR